MMRLLFLMLINIMICVTKKENGDEKITYISVEQAVVLYFNPKYVVNASTSARRYSRSDPIHYYHLYVHSKISIDNNITADFYFYELLTNVYKRGFIEMHFKACQLIDKDPFFGAPMKQALIRSGVKTDCPYPPGEYDLHNMTVPITAIPKGFPFTKGRIYLNSSYLPTKELVASGYVNMEIKQMKKIDFKRI